jgi:hypothetical protein
VARRAAGGPPEVEPAADAGPAARSRAALFKYGSIRQRNEHGTSTGPHADPEDADLRGRWITPGLGGSCCGERREPSRWPLRPEAKLRGALSALLHG